MVLDPFYPTGPVNRYSQLIPHILLGEYKRYNRFLRRNMIPPSQIQYYPQWGITQVHTLINRTLLNYYKNPLFVSSDNDRLCCGQKFMNPRSLNHSFEMVEFILCSKLCFVFETNCIQRAFLIYVWCECSVQYKTARNKTIILQMNVGCPFCSAFAFAAIR